MAAGLARPECAPVNTDLALSHTVHTDTQTNTQTEPARVHALHTHMHGEFICLYSQTARACYVSRRWRMLFTIASRTASRDPSSPAAAAATAVASNQSRECGWKSGWENSGSGRRLGELRLRPATPARPASSPVDASGNEAGRKISSAGRQGLPGGRASGLRLRHARPAGQAFSLVGEFGNEEH